MEIRSIWLKWYETLFFQSQRRHNKSNIFSLSGRRRSRHVIRLSGGNPLAAAAAGLLVNARHVPFGVTVRDLVGSRAASFLGCHIMNDESVVFGLSQKTPEQRKAAFWLCGLGVAIFWPVGTLIGAGVGKLLPAPETIGLDAVFPAILLAFVVPAFKNRTTLIRACSGAGLSLAAIPFAPVGLPVLLSLFGLLTRKK